jgi:hypothetical protein
MRAHRHPRDRGRPTSSHICVIVEWPSEGAGEACDATEALLKSRKNGSTGGVVLSRSDVTGIAHM